MYKLFLSLFFFCYFLLSFLCYSHQHKIDSEDYSIYRLNDMKLIHMGLLDKLNVGTDNFKTQSEITEWISDNIEIYGLIFFYDNEDCSHCLPMHDVLIEFMLKYDTSIVYAVPCSGGKSNYEGFYDFDVEIEDSKILEWAKPLPSIFLYDCVSDDVIFISNSFINLEELELRLANYIVWADDIEETIFVKMCFLDILYDVVFDYNDFSYIVLCNDNSKVKDLEKYVRVEPKIYLPDGSLNYAVMEVLEEEKERRAIEKERTYEMYKALHLSQFDFDASGPPIFDEDRLIKIAFGEDETDVDMDETDVDIWEIIEELILAVGAILSLYCNRFLLYIFF